MKFKKLISEGDEYNTLVNKYLELSHKLTYILPDRFGVVEEFEESLWDGKDISTELNKYNALYKELETLVNKLSTFDNFKRGLLNNAKREMSQYSYTLETYTIKNRNVQEIVTCVNKGENQDTALKKLAKLSKTAKYYNHETKKTIEFFDEYTVDDLKKQIDEYDGHVVLRGAMDYNVVFKNNKVLNVYF